MKKKAPKRISKLESEFVAKLLKLGNSFEAYKQTFKIGNLTESQIRGRAASVKNRPHVRKALIALQKKVTVEFEFGIQDILKEWYDIATADPNELSSNMRRCCRYCYGRGHLYQWKDGQQFADAFASWARTPTKERGECPNDEGGYGFNFTFRPHPECTECRGEGIQDTFFADTRNLSPKGRKLFAGIKQTANGMQVLTRDQDAALLNLAKFHGMFVEKHQHTGAGGAPLISATVTLPDDPVAAANIYADMIKNSARQ